METAVDELGMPRLNPSEERLKLVVIMGPTGSGKSKLAIDLASHFPIEIINADSMQVYGGLDVLTNKVPFHEQDGVRHHLLGTISPNAEFTAKDFRDSAIPLINDILARNCIPVIVGGTNYYIQALVSPFLLDDAVEDADECCLSGPTGEHQENELDIGRDSSSDSYDRLKDIDPVAANRIHPNNHRRITQYLNLYSRSGIPPSKFFLEKTAVNWGQVDNFRYNCCFICVDSSLPVLDRYVDQRVDCMIEAGLLKEVLDIYSLNADYTRGLRQAIGVREFEDFLRSCTFEGKVDEEINSTDWSHLLKSINEGTRISVGNIGVFSDIFNDEQHKMLKEAIDKMKLNTRRLVRRQKRRLNQLQTLFGWSIHHVDATESISRKSEDLWASQVVEPAAKIIRSFINENGSTSPDLQSSKRMSEKLIQRDLWTQYTCKACGDRVLRGSHEWEQHIQGRSHRKRVSQLRKSQRFYFMEQQQSDTLNV